MNLTDFPILASAFDPNSKGGAYRLSTLEKALGDLTAGLKAGSIANPVYVAAKDAVARAIDEGWSKKVQEVYLARGRGNPDAYPDEVVNLCYYSHPKAHTIPGLLKKIEKLPKSDVVDAAIAFLREIGPLGLAVVKCKDLAVKRQPKADPDAERKAKYDAPRVEGTAIGIVKDILTKITDDAYANLLKMLNERYDRLLDRYIELHNEALTIPSRQRYYSQQDKTARAIAHDNTFIYQAIEETSEGNSIDGRPYRRNAKAADLVAKTAKEHADQTREYFIYKNLDKIASILDAKGNFKDAKLLNTTVLNGLEGTIRFTFEDGSAFTVQNAVVYVVNSYGTQFNRFPLTFHEVTLPDGSRMPRPSEERMNTVFVGKGEGA